MMFEKNENSETERLIQNNVNNDDLDINEETLSSNEEVNSIGVKYKNVNEGMEVKKIFQQKQFYILSAIICLFNLGGSLVTSNYKVC